MNALPPALRRSLLGVLVALASIAVQSLANAQQWVETCGKSPAGVVALRQAVLDTRSDLLVLLVAAHPDDRYVLPAVWLRYGYGARIAVLLATRGGGGQNSIGPESGDALERIRTLEVEAGCSHFDGEVWYLNRPDGGYRRTAEEAYGEWGEEETLRDLVRLIRTIRPDVVLTTHHRQEQHGHDLATVDLLTRAAPLLARPDYLPEVEPHTVALLGTGATAALPNVVSIPVNRLEPTRGATLRQLAWNILRTAHRSPGAPAAAESLFESQLRLELRPPPPQREFPFDRLPSVFDDGIWPGTDAAREELRRFLHEELPALVADRTAPGVPERLVAALATMRALAQLEGASVDARRRLHRRIEAVERVLLQLAEAKVVLEVPPGTFAVEGEELRATVHVHVGAGISARLAAEGLGGVEARLEPGEEGRLSLPSGGARRAEAVIQMPLGTKGASDPMAARFRGDRFVPPVRLRFRLELNGTEVPVDLTVPIEERPPVELTVLPRHLLFPASRRELQFSVGVARRTSQPIAGLLEVRAPAGYAIKDDRVEVELRDQRGDTFQFEVRAAENRRPGTDVLGISLAGTTVTLPIRKVDVEVPALRIGVLRGGDDTLPGILGVGGLGLSPTPLGDADVAVGNLDSFDTIVVDIRALRDRPAARRGFRRLLDFAEGKGHRLVVFYHKDVEFQPAGEEFRAAPYPPFLVGSSRVTRPDAPVTVLLPDHPLLNHPNRIEPWDWDEWQQERALYLPSVYSSQFDELLEMNDPGQAPERGALLYTRTGEGEYVYCALALWRQLKKLHPGAVRLLANLLTPAGR